MRMKEWEERTARFAGELRGWDFEVSERMRTCKKCGVNKNGSWSGFNCDAINSAIWSAFAFEVELPPINNSVQMR
jgi:hypothetical protein